MSSLVSLATEESYRKDTYGTSSPYETFRVVRPVREHGLCLVSYVVAQTSEVVLPSSFCFHPNPNTKKDTTLYPYNKL